MNKTGEARSYSAGDKLPESTGDKLPTGGLIQLSWGDFGLHWGMAPLDVRYSAGEQSYIKTVGDACYESLYTPLGNIEISGENPTSLRLIVA